MKIKSIVVIGFKWFDKINGNTYFRAEGIINGKRDIIIEFEYGYGDHYLDAIGDLIIKKYMLPVESYKYGAESISSYCRRCKIPLYYTARYVARRKDL